MSASVPDTSTIDGLIGHRSKKLTEYQNATYAEHYRARIDRISGLERERIPGHSAITGAVARFGYKLMAYKDEYEVARLLSDPAFLRQIEREFEGPYKVVLHLAPPLLARRDPVTGHLRKRAYGPWTLPLLRILASLKGLRGTWMDPFGHTQERRTERRLADEYFDLMEAIVAVLTPANAAIALELASLPDEIRGYGHVKEAGLARYAARRRELLEVLHNAGAERKADADLAPRAVVPS